MEVGVGMGRRQYGWNPGDSSAGKRAEALEKARHNRQHVGGRSVATQHQQWDRGEPRNRIDRPIDDRFTSLAANDHDHARDSIGLEERAFERCDAELVGRNDGHSRQSESVQECRKPRFGLGSRRRRIGIDQAETRAEDFEDLRPERRRVPGRMKQE